MTRTRSNSWTASKASCQRIFTPPCVRPRWSVYADVSTRLNDNVLTSTHAIPSFAVLPCMESSALPVLFSFFLVAPLTFFFPGRVAFRTLGIFCCILIVFFCHARGSNLYPPFLTALVAVFPCPMRYTLTKFVLTLQGYLYPLRATLYGYPGMTDTYDSRILFHPTHPVATCFILHITFDDSILRVCAMKNKN